MTYYTTTILANPKTASSSAVLGSPDPLSINRSNIAFLRAYLRVFD